jgi:hypothetical protein
LWTSSSESIQKKIDVDVFVKGNSALANVEADAAAFGPNSVAETAAFTQTLVEQGKMSASSSVAESMSAATKDWAFHW